MYNGSLSGAVGIHQLRVTIPTLKLLLFNTPLRTYSVHVPLIKSRRFPQGTSTDVLSSKPARPAQAPHATTQAVTLQKVSQPDPVRKCTNLHIDIASVCVNGPAACPQAQVATLLEFSSAQFLPLLLRLANQKRAGRKHVIQPMYCLSNACCFLKSKFDARSECRVLLAFMLLWHVP